MTIAVNHTLDAKGLSCPMPIVRTKKTMNELAPGEVLEVQATDKGSLADMKAWAESTGHHYLGTVEEGVVYRHFLRKANPMEVKEEAKYPHIVNLEELAGNLGKEDVTILDVREPAEYAFGHIPGAVSIPMGELETRLTELNRNHELFVICRTGVRSDFAAQRLAEKGFSKVFNVVPGMQNWNGQVF